MDVAQLIVRISIFLSFVGFLRWLGGSWEQLWARPLSVYSIFSSAIGGCPIFI